MWLALAFCGPVLWAASTHIDKYLVERFFKESGVGTLLIFTSLIGLVPMPFIAAFEPDVLRIGWPAIAVITTSGLLYMGAMYFYLGALQQEEASVIAPLFQASPLFTYALAYVVLGERLTPVQLLGGALIVSSALLVSWRPNAGERSKLKLRMIALMLACALALALSSVIFKLFAIHDEFWTTTFWVFAGEAIFGAVLLAIPNYRRQFIHMFAKNPGPVIAINGANEIINLAGGLAARYASLLGPVALVGAIGSTTSLFVFLFGVLLSIFFPALSRETLSARSLIQKGVAVILIGVGVVLIGGTR
ncbi:MAG TPA: DMT family transporter [Rhizomicrobium sp.]|jgi:drug/metabolite transporter (DMT)-like permease|nr:DMT family transporter [Rhizomicrobium sp.]